MGYRLNRRMISLGTCLLVAHAALLFFVIPEMSAKLAPSVNQDIYADGYELLASNLISGHGYRFYPDTAATMMREPGYPLVLAGLFTVLGKNFAFVKLVNMLLAFATVGLMALLLRPFASYGQKIPLPLFYVAAILFLFHPGVLVAESRGGVEIVFAFSVALFCLSISRAVAQDGWRRYIVSGLILGVTVLVRSTLLLFPFFLLMYLLLMQGRAHARLKSLRNVGLLVLIMLATMSPWIIRNFRLTGKFVPTASVFGVSAQAGEYMNEHLFEGRPLWLLDREASRKRDAVAIEAGLPFKDGENGYYQTFFRTADELTFSNLLAHRTMGRYRESPMLFVRCLLQNLINFWFAGKTWSVFALNVAIQAPYLALAFVGVRRVAKANGLRHIAVAVLLIGYVVMLHAPIIAQARYSIPLIPLVSVFAAIGISAIFDRRRSIPVVRSAPPIEARIG